MTQLPRTIAAWALAWSVACTLAPSAGRAASCISATCTCAYAAARAHGATTAPREASGRLERGAYTVTLNPGRRGSR